MMDATTVVIGAGHAGLAMSSRLAERSVEHVVLERGVVANSWRTERWDSLRLLTPNWQNRLPGMLYEGCDPDGFMTVPEVVAFIDSYSAAINAPVHTNTTVTQVAANDDGYRVTTDRGVWDCATVVIASGAANITNVPRPGSSSTGLGRHGSPRSPTDRLNISTIEACSWSAPRLPVSSSPTRSAARGDPSRSRSASM